MGEFRHRPIGLLAIWNCMPLFGALRAKNTVGKKDDRAAIKIVQGEWEGFGKWLNQAKNMS
jgi:hypothetical protein